MGQKADRKRGMKERQKENKKPGPRLECRVAAWGEAESSGLKGERHEVCEDFKIRFTPT